MQVLEELVVSKGKRTKRQRLPSPLRLATPSASCNNAGTTTSYNNNDNSGGLDLAISLTNSPSTTIEYQLRDRTEEEEEDMANCLILLAQGHHMMSHTPAPRHHNNNNNNHNKKSGLYLYECKTCNRCFPSSQALGGHRASHSKLNYKANGNGNGNGNGTEEKQTVTAFVNRDHGGGDPTTNTILSLQIPNTATFSATTATTKKSKFHECSICGAEFSSGQALGGHMRRHRNLVSTSTTTSNVSGGNVMGGGSSPKSQEANYKKPRNVLKLDLNLPAAPEDDQRESSKFSFQPRDNVIAFSARSSLVDCHY